MSADYSLRAFANSHQFTEFFLTTAKRKDSLAAIRTDQGLTLAAQRDLPPDRKLLSDYFFQLLQMNQKVFDPVNMELAQVVFDFGKSDPRFLKIYQSSIANKREQPSHSFEIFPLPIIDASAQCVENTKTFLRGSESPWSLSELLEMASFLYSQTMEKEASRLFALFIDPQLLQDPDRFTREMEQFLQRNAESLDEDETNAKMHQAQAIGQLLKKELYDHSSLFLELPSSLLQWLLSKSVVKEPGEYESIRALQYYYGKGEEQSVEKAIEWWNQSTKLGFAESYVDLAICYRETQPKHSDPKIVLECFQKAAEKNIARAYVGLGNCHFFGWGVDPCKEEGYRHYLRGAEMGSAVGYLQAAECCWAGTGTAQDDAQGFAWFLRAARLGSGKGYFKVGQAYHFGKGVEKDLKKAFDAYQKAVEFGWWEGFVEIGNCYWRGEGVEQSDAQPFICYERGAKKGVASAFTGLGHCYYCGRGAAQSYEQAVENYREAAELGCAEGWCHLGECYMSGKGVEKDPQQGLACFQESARLGSSKGKLKLEKCEKRS